ncbi:heparan-alpha-glucosaminide N-acetyltransferase domain-containing protein, partial [Streptomyces sp. NPDC020362]
MTPNPSLAVSSEVAPELEAARSAVPSGTSSTAPSGTSSTERLIGVDLARGLAVLGMYSVHVGPDVSVGGPVGFLLETARGRSSALFALLAGFSLVIITGRPCPRTGRAGRQAVGRVVIRAVVLVMLGYALSALDTPIDVILSFYGVLFLAVLPLHRMRVATLALIAAAGALVLPQILYLVQKAIEDGTWPDAVIAADPLARITGTDGLIELLFTGEYPVLTWMPFLIAGMAVARLDLGRPGVRSRLALVGGVCTVLGYGGSWLALRLVPHALSAVAAATDGGSASSAWWSDTVGDPEGSTPPAWLLVAAPHSQTTFSIVGNMGVALVVLSTCLALSGGMPRLSRSAAPLAAVGRTALTLYVLHIVALWFFTD